jgi:putative ABC transport system permease protein
LSNNPDILSITRGFNPVGSGVINGNVGTMGGLSWKGKKEDNDIMFSFSWIDADYAKTFQLEMKEGRFFSSEFSTDSAAVVINETAAKILGFKDPIGQVLSDRFGPRYNIIGVVKDFHFASMHHKIEPLLMTLGGNRCFLIKIRPGRIVSTTDFVKKTFESHNLPFRLDLQFLEDDFNNLYRTEQGMGKIFSWFALLAIIISCLGLIGLSTFMTERRTKEIGIRKANGAKSHEVFIFLSKEYLVWVVISIIIACPIAWYFMNKWLQNFAYRTNLNLWLFVLAGVIALIVALLTVGFQSYKAAAKNPVDALRYE